MMINCLPSPLLAADAYRAYAAVLRPPEPMEPSEYAAKFRVLKEGTTERPGPWDNSHFPYLKPIMDAVAEAIREGKIGLVLMKSAQGGGSEAIINTLFWLKRYFPGPILYLISKDDIAAEFGRDRFGPAIETIPHLKAMQLPGREQILTKRFADGKVAIAGGKSVLNIQSIPYRFVFLDELDSMLDEIKDQGDPLKIAAERTASFSGAVLIIAFAHPTTKERGAAHLYYESSDQRRGFVVCPHCAGEFWLQWAHVKATPRRAGQMLEQAERDPGCYAYYCPHCACEISDAQRVAAVRNVVYRSILSADDAQARPWIGMHFSQLYYPHKSVFALAQKWVGCLDKESEKIVFIQKTLGEPYEPAVKKTTVEDWRALIVVPRRLDDPEAYRRGEIPRQAQFLTAGIDSRNFELHWVVWAWGLRRLVDEYLMLCGWAVDWGKIDRSYRVKQARNAEFSESDYEVFDDVLFRKIFERTGGGAGLALALGLFDTGWAPTQIPVYQYCRRHPARAIPVKGGADTSLSTRPYMYQGAATSYKFGDELVKDENLRMLNTFILKTQFFGMVKDRLKIVEATQTGMSAPREVTRLCLPVREGREDEEEFLKHCSAEGLMRSGRRAVEIWKAQTHDNHWSDGNIYAYAGALQLDAFRPGLPYAEAELIADAEAVAAGQADERAREAARARAGESVLSRYGVGADWIKE